MTTDVLKQHRLRPLRRLEIRPMPRVAAAPAGTGALGQIAGILALAALGAIGIAIRVFVYAPL
jgi:hypothetical protein